MRDLQKRVKAMATYYENAKKAALKGLALSKAGKTKAAEAQERKAKYWWDKFENG